ncbi:MAG: hypothetical protein DDT40_01924 [candidate division WS2 bacterium]|nr:hypothetical protein [Candidatus Psychracetigena formicireducens]
MTRVKTIFFFQDLTGAINLPKRCGLLFTETKSTYINKKGRIDSMLLIIMVRVNGYDASRGN